ncbi:MAG: DNA (cytosine-5-)-methyltransferase [Acidimicrobiaceae bacterium]|nr:DNA (cytosine-5-)-methyltransferase [Acidimicrobiaceae bacterium]
MRAAEFFAGMGLMRAGLESVGVSTVFANDIDPHKAALYRSNWGSDELVVDDIRNLTGDMIPDIEIATASFPCTDLSLAGNYAGLAGEQSGLISEFVRILGEMQWRRPDAVIVENVPGLLTANDGRDFRRVRRMLEGLDYDVADIMINASAFLPQSRARVFLLCTLGHQPGLPELPTGVKGRLADVATEGGWWPPERTEAFLSTLSPLQRRRIDAHRTSPDTRHLGAFRRTRRGSTVWEVRDDEIAGTLRTLRGGSGRQAIVKVGNGDFAVRWMNVTEYARLQGAEAFRFDAVSERQAMFALGDAVCVPVVEWIAQHWLTRVEFRVPA